MGFRRASERTVGRALGLVALLVTLFTLEACGSGPERPADRMLVELEHFEIGPDARRAFLLRAPKGARLVLEGFDDPGESGAIRVFARSDGGVLVDDVVEVAGEPVTLDLGLDHAQAVEVTLATEGSGRGSVSRLQIVFPGSLDDPSPRRAANPDVPASDQGVESDPAWESPPARPNLVVYLIDTLRADRLGAYGYDRGTSPTIDSFAASGTLFERAVAPSSWTRPSVASLFTGLLPQSHRVLDRRDVLDGSATTLAELLRAAGYRTLAVQTNPNIGRRFGFDQGFEVYGGPGKQRRRAEVVAELFEAWLEDTGAGGDDAPFFAYLHTVEPHAPYAPREPFRSRFGAGDAPEELSRVRTFRQVPPSEMTDQQMRWINALYDAEVAMADAGFAGLLELLDRRGLTESTVVALVSDHGEELREHGKFAHGKSLYTEVLDIPFVVAGPGVATGRIGQVVSLTDLMPTLLELAGAEVPSGLHARSLMPALEGRVLDSLPVVSHLDLDGYRGAAISDPWWRLIEPRSEIFGERTMLFDRALDPRELADLAADRAVTADWLTAVMDGVESSIGGGVLPSGTATLDQDLEEDLRALGYLQDADGQ